MAVSKVRKPTKPKGQKGGRPSKHPWDEIEALFVQGEDQERAGKDGRSETVHEWPTQADLSKRYNVGPVQVCKRFALKGSDGKTALERREAFKQHFQRQVDDKMARELAGREVGFRTATMIVAEMGLRHIATKLNRPNGSGGIASVGNDDLSKLMTAAKRAQEVGMVALDRPADGPGGAGGGKGGDLGTEDWSIMREVRRGGIPVPELGE